MMSLEKGLFCNRYEDLEALGYCIMWLLGKDRLPWNDCQNDKAETLKRKRYFVANDSPDPLF
jgi:hypothetical protein